MLRPLSHVFRGTHVRLIRLAMVLAIAVGLGVSGCKPKNEPPEVLSVQGRIENIKVADNGGEITVAYFNERQNQEMVGTALVTAQTEIMINGAAAKLSDLRNGERVRGDVRVEKRDNQRTLTALKIYADRADVQPAAPKPQEQNAPGGGS